MIYVHLGIAAWFALAWLAYRHEHRELVEKCLVENAYAQGAEAKAALAVECERMRRFDMSKVPFDVNGGN